VGVGHTRESGMPATTILHTKAPPPVDHGCLQPGALVLCRDGEYGDARVDGLYRVLRKFDATVLALFRAAAPVVPQPQERISLETQDAWRAYGDRYAPDTFLAWLVAEQYLEPVPHANVFLGTQRAECEITDPEER